MFRTALLTAVFAGACAVAHAQEDYVILKTFKLEPPYTISVSPSPLVKGRDGNFYGRNGHGVFKVTPDGSFSTLGHVLVTATAIDGGDGFFYTVTHPSTGTAIVKFTEGGEPTPIYQFTAAAQGGLASLVQGRDGQLYGTIRHPAGFPTLSAELFRLTTDGVFTTLHAFPWDDGAVLTQIIAGTDGDFYGVTARGLGRVFRATPDGTVTTVHAFTGGMGGAYPQPYLLQASDGSLYGATRQGGAANAGVIFRLRPDGAYSVLYSLPGVAVNGIDDLSAPLIEGTDGNFYGTSSGTIFRLTPGGDVKVLHSVGSGYPPGAASARYGAFLEGVVEGTNGNLYGTVPRFGPDGDGLLFRLNRQRSPCANVIDLLWRPDNGGVLRLDGVVKTETPAFYSAWLVTQHAVTPLWARLTPAIDPTFVFQLEVPLASSGPIGVFTLLITSNLNVCADWKTTDTGGTGPTPAALQGLMVSKGG
jgi:uncharacterized repeat protein (TIGR03803 family)